VEHRRYGRPEPRLKAPAPRGGYLPGVQAPFDQLPDLRSDTWRHVAPGVGHSPPKMAPPRRWRRAGPGEIGIEFDTACWPWPEQPDDVQVRHSITCLGCREEAERSFQDDLRRTHGSGMHNKPVAVARAASRSSTTRCRATRALERPGPLVTSAASSHHAHAVIAFTKPKTNSSRAVPVRGDGQPRVQPAQTVSRRPPSARPAQPARHSKRSGVPLTDDSTSKPVTGLLRHDPGGTRCIANRNRAGRRRWTRGTSTTCRHDDWHRLPRCNAPPRGPPLGRDSRADSGLPPMWAAVHRRPAREPGSHYSATTRG